MSSAEWQSVAYAHSASGRPPEAWHRLEDHLIAVADRTASFMAQMGLPPEIGHAAGILHDVGKFSRAFQKRLHELASLEQPGHLENVTCRHVDHSTAGAQFAARRLGDVGKLIAYAVAGHHTGLPNGLSPDTSCLSHRLQNQVEDWSSCPPDLLPSPRLPFPPLDCRSPRVGFQIAFFTRMLYSCLVDADFLDTEAFLEPTKATHRTSPTSLQQLRDRLERYLTRFSPDSPINQLRADVLASCRRAAAWPPGFFSLTVPTGGGKTLSSLAFALDHAVTHGLQRVIYVIPYTSIIEQNADVFRAALGDDAVLEHHSNFDHQKETPWSRLAAENWDALLIVTTNVQFFESLFSAKPSACRKLHNIARSVIILDEAQMLPPDFLRPCLEALRELVRAYGATVVLCTATQPALSTSPEFPDGLDDVREIIPDPKALSIALKRVQTSYRGPLDDSALAESLMHHHQVLCIVNTRAHARRLAEQLPDAVHLSALMCPQHRSDVLETIRARLKAKLPCRVISTSLVEAGVDIDFPVVYRALAGIDSLAQAAGRCNREATRPYGEFFIFEPDNVQLCGHLLLAAQQAAHVLRHHHSDPLSLDAVHDFFRALFWDEGDLLDKHAILQKLEEGRQGNIPFRDVADIFKLIDDHLKPVVIPYDERAKTLIAAARDATSLRPFARHLQRYTVQIYPHEWEALRANGKLDFIQDVFPVLTSADFYNPRLGLLVPESLNPSPESLVT
ncbi:MAG: CRISPR-associated endonuclease Cas3'', partial [bacterium]|nr:CRISPR-associated endonuclease Cas3'' [bacterium]